MIRVIQAQFSLLVEKLEQLLTTPAPDQLLYRIELPLPVLELKGFLSAQSMTEKAYWSDRDGNYSIAVLGYSWSQSLNGRNDIEVAFAKGRELLGNLPATTDTRCLCYLSFADDPESIWPDFGYGRVILPLIDVVATRSGNTLGVNLRVESDLEWQRSIRKTRDIIRGLHWQQQFLHDDFVVDLMGYAPALPQWCSMVNDAKQAFAHKSLNKVVLSREACFNVRGRLSPWALLHSWKQANPQSYQFCFQGQTESFFGCSPERLVKRLENVVYTEALAGTTIRGADSTEDDQYEQQLRNDRKNIHENRLVLDDICRQLMPHCQSLKADERHSIVKLRHVQHLRYQVRGVLKAGVYDEQLIVSLQPTPAVGGTPRKDALSFIKHHEPYARGLYTGVCGVMGVQSSDFSVAIRSARLTDHSLRLYSGAGIVEDSVPEEEWRELNNKITTALNILNHQQERKNSFQVCS